MPFFKALLRCIVIASLFFPVQQAKASLYATGLSFQWVTDQSYSGVAAGTTIYFHRGSFDAIDAQYDLQSEAWYKSDPNYTPDFAIGTALGAALNAKGASFWSGIHPYSAAAENPRLMFGVHKHSSGDHPIFNMSSTINSNHTWDVVGNDIGPYKSTSRTRREDQGTNNIDDRAYWWASTTAPENYWTLEADVGGLSAGTRIGFVRGSFNEVNAAVDLLNQPWYIENPGPNEDDSLSIELHTALEDGKVFTGFAAANPVSSDADNPKLMFLTKQYSQALSFQPVTLTGNTNVHGDWSLSGGSPNFDLNDSSGVFDATFDTIYGDKNVYHWAYVLTAVPEPSTIAVWSVLGLCGVGYGLRRKKRKTS